MDWTRAARVAGTYLLLSIVWILLSDWALAAAGLDPDRFGWVQSAKGSTFVVLTALLLFGLIRRELRTVARVRDLLRAVVDGTTDAVFVKDRDGHYLLCNPAAAGFLGRSPADVLGRTDAEFLERESARRVLQDDRQVMNEEQERMFEQTLTVAGVTRTFKATKAPYRDAAGAVIGVVGISRDVTDQKRLEKQYQQAVKMEAVGRLAGGVAHDFNNLLTVINGYSDILLGTLPEGDPSRPLVEEVRKAGERAAGLTRQLLAFSRRQVVQQTVFDLGGLVADLAGMLRRVLGEDIDVVARSGPDPLPVRADRGQLEQVVMNLAVNARDAMPRGGTLTIETRPVVRDDGRTSMLAVTDTGCGMTEDVLAHLFEPFFTTKGPDKGTGLGLAVVHGVVEQAGGRVEVDSRVGAGTTFRVYLPAAADGARTAESPALRADAAGGAETILLVEDDEDVRALLLRGLQQAGYTVLDAASGEQAVRVVAAHGVNVHLLVTDVVMPGMGGRELADRLQAAYPALRVLFVSGYTDDAVVRYAVEHEAVNFLQKPFTPATLARKVREALDAGATPT